MKNESDITMKNDDYSTSTDDILNLDNNSDEDSNIPEILGFNDLEQDADTDDTDEDLLALLEMISGQEESNNAERNSQDSQDEIVALDDNSESWATDISDNQSFDNDIFSISDLLGDEALNFEEEIDETFDTNEEDVFALDEENGLFENQFNEKELDSNSVSNVGDIFSDVLSAVDTLEDDNDEDILNLIPNLSNQNTNEITEDTKKKKKGLWKKLFDKDNENKDNQKLDIENNEQESKKESKKEQTKDSEKAKKAKAKKEKVKADKVKKASKTTSKDEEGTTESKNQKKAVKDKGKKAEKKQAKPKKVKVKKDKVKKVNVVDEVIDFEDTKPLNKVAIILIMTFFILIAGTITVGTNVYSYNLGIENATFDFEIQRYNEAYNQISGLDIKKSDQEIYDKIMTVMFVQKQLNSYNGYFELKKYPEALDSLLKGLERYNKYIDLAKDLGIEKDLEIIKSQIITELADKYDISEKEAKALYNTEDQTQYSINVYNTVIEKMN
jgi:hypothetical protein